METIRGAGCVVGEYVGDGHGDESTSAQDANLDDNIDPGVDDQFLDDEEEDSSDDAHPLLIFYDCETGFSVYKEHITDMASKVVACHVPCEDIPTHPSSWYVNNKNSSV